MATTKISCFTPSAKTLVMLAVALIFSLAAIFPAPTRAASVDYPASSLAGLTSFVKADADSLAGDVNQTHESIFPGATRSLIFSHFTWGAELGASIDLSGNDMSTFNIDALFGYKNSWIRIAGVGIGVHRSFGKGNMFYPVYGVFRSSFTSRPSLLFASVTAGYSFNSIEGSKSKGGFKSSVGVGVNLAMSRRFQSHIILSAGLTRFDRDQALAAGLSVRNVYFADITFGMNF